MEREAVAVAIVIACLVLVELGGEESEERQAGPAERKQEFQRRRRGRLG